MGRGSHDNPVFRGMHGKSIGSVVIAGVGRRGECQTPRAINERRFLRLVEVTPPLALQMLQVLTERLRRTSAS